MKLCGYLPPKNCNRCLNKDITTNIKKREYEDIMKTLINKTALISALLLAFSGIVAADGLSDSLGNPANATDYYVVDCQDDGRGPPNQLTVQVADNLPSAAPVVSVQVTKDFGAFNSTDQIDGDALFSPWVTLKGGAGSYFITVDKSKAGVESYSLTYHCQTSTGVHTGTSIFTLKNQ
jgi:hypothetical protein